MVKTRIPSRNELSLKDLAHKMYGQATPSDVELVSLKILVSALSVILLEKGICSRKDLQKYVEDAQQMYETLKSLEESQYENR